MVEKAKKYQFKTSQSENDEDCYTIDKNSGKKLDNLCPSNLDYGPYDAMTPPPIDPKQYDAIFKKYLLISNVEAILNDIEAKSANDNKTKQTLEQIGKERMRQYVLGVMDDIRGTYDYSGPLEKYFKIMPVYSTEPKYPEITWDTNFNDMFISCIVDHITNGINKTLFPLRISMSQRHMDIDGTNSVDISRYSPVSKDEIDKMTYKGCILVPSHDMGFYIKDIKHDCGDNNCDIYKQQESFYNEGINKYLNIDVGMLHTKCEPNQDQNSDCQRYQIKQEYVNDTLKYGKIAVNISKEGNKYLKYLLEMIEYITNGDQDKEIKLWYGCNRYNTPIIIKRGLIKHLVRIYYFYVFDTGNRFLMYNPKSNIVEPGDLIERFRYIHIEINMIMQLLKKEGKEMILHRYKDDIGSRIFFYSPYLDNGNYFENQYVINLLEKLEKYPDLKEKYESFLKNLSPYNIRYRKTDKIFMLVPLELQQSGGSKSKKTSSHKSNTSSHKSNTSTHQLSSTKLTKLNRSKYRNSIFVSEDAYVLNLKDKENQKYSWNIKKSKSEEIFYNYPINTLIEKITQQQKLMDNISSKMKINVKDKQEYSIKVVEEFYNLKKYVKTYS